MYISKIDIALLILLQMILFRELHHNKIPDFSICLFHNLMEILHM